MTAETCPRCGRKMFLRVYGSCNDPLGDECNMVSAAYRRGIDEGVRLAKERATIHREYEHIDDWIDWTDVDAAAAKAKGEA